MPGIKIGVDVDTTGLSKGLGAASGQVSAFGKSMDIGGVAAMAGVAGVAVIAGKALLDMGQAASQDRAEQDKLTAAVAAATGSQEDHTAAIDEAIAAGQEKAFTDTQTREALQSLVTATGDLTSATALLGPAQDIARFAGVDLATAADAVAKAQAGQDGALRKMMPGLEKGATTMDTLGNATKMAAGQADTYAKSGPGMADKTSDAMGELGETLGTAVLPLLDAMMPALQAIIKALGALITAVLPILIPLMKALGAVIGVVGNAIAAALGFVAKLVTALLGLLAPIQKVLDGLGSIHLPFGIGGGGGSSGSQAAGVSGFASTSYAGSGGFVVNVYGGDPAQVQAQVVSALRLYTARNGTAGLYGTGLAQGGA